MPVRQDLPERPVPLPRRAAVLPGWRRRPLHQYHVRLEQLRRLWHQVHAGEPLPERGLHGGLPPAALTACAIGYAVVAVSIGGGRPIGPGLELLLLVMGVTLAQEKKAERGARGTRARGKIVAMDLKDGTGTLTVMTRGRGGAEGKEVKFMITKDTKFGKGAGRGKQPTPVDADKVNDTFKKDTNVSVQFEKSGDDMIAKSVTQFTPRRRGGGR